MVQRVKVQCPAKINLDLKIIGRRPDGFHNIESTMQTISLYDYLTISYKPSEALIITIAGTSGEIPYDERNIVYKAAKLFFDTIGKVGSVDIFIEKYIPVSAGLAGGSTDAAGTLFGLNELLGNPLERKELHELCAKLGSDLNFCLEGGCKKTTSRGEVLEDAEFIERNVSLIKPIQLGISAKEAYTKFAAKEKTTERDSYINDLEWAVIEDYPELQIIKNKYPQAVMTGSGSTYFAFETEFLPLEGYWIKNDLKTTKNGIIIV